MCNHLNSNATVGFDNISIKLLKNCITIIAPVLVSIINYSFQNGIFPNLLKIARITHVFKCGDPNNMFDYRPISVLSALSKLFEKIIYKRLFSFCLNHKIIYDRQFGFMPKFNTTLAAIDALDNVTKSLDNNKYTVGIFLDIQKAFDSINHNILLKKLNHYGVRSICNKFFIAT